jgi:hypothetical protein
MPPTPRSDWISYGPNLVPRMSAIDHGDYTFGVRLFLKYFKFRHRGIFKVGWVFTFAAAAYNLIACGIWRFKRRKPRPKYVRWARERIFRSPVDAAKAFL